MRGYVFASEEALQAALASRLVAPEVQAAPAQVSRRADGSVLVRPSRALGREQVASLKQAGVVVVDERSTATQPAVCWAEAVRARKAQEPLATPALALFLVPGAGQGLLELCGEMLRLGCDRQEIQTLKSGDDTVALVRVREPPYFTVASALDHVKGVRAFEPLSAARSNVWVELSHQHPLAPALEVPEGKLLLVSGEAPWLLLDEGQWTDVYGLIQLEVPKPPQLLEGLVPRERLRVPLKLSRRGRQDPASLWVLREGAQTRVEHWVRTLPEETLRGLSFAVCAEAVVLHARPTAKPQPLLDLADEAYAPLPELPNVFAPVGMGVIPWVRRDRLRELLGADPEQLTWLRPATLPLPNVASLDFFAERLPEGAFRPLVEWVEYVVDQGAAALEPWVRSTSFELERFSAVEADEAEATRDDAAPPAPVEKASPPRTKPPPSRESLEPTTAEPVLAEPTAAASSPSAAQLALEGLEQTFLSVDEPADAPSRKALWVRMAEIHTQLGNEREATLCWTRAFWEASDSEAAEVLSRWTANESAPLEQLLLLGEEAAPRLVKQLLQRVSSAQPAPLPPKTLEQAWRWVDVHDDKTDVRTAWLMRSALARLSGGDRLALAVAKDRALSRLHRGLSMERDVPRFIRAARGKDSTRALSGAAHLTTQLESLLAWFERTPRKRMTIEAPVELTRAYVCYVFAWGFGRLGHAERARELVALCKRALDERDAVHGFLGKAYRSRIDDALEGRDWLAPMPAEVSSELNRLDAFARYKVDRLRQASQILEPQERLDPFLAFHQGSKDVRGEEFARLREERDPQALAEQLEALVGSTSRAHLEVAERARLLEGVLDFLPLLSEGQAVPLLTVVVDRVKELSPTTRVPLLESALNVAGHFDRRPLVGQLAAELQELLATMDAQAAGDWVKALAACVRNLKRVGLRDEASVLLDAASRAVPGEGVRALIAKLTLAGGFAYLGRMARALPILDEGFSQLMEEKGSVVDRLALTRATATALGHSPTDVAVQGLSRLATQLPWVTDSYNTNSHFCLSVVDFADALVVAHVSDDLAMAPTARRFLDEDELLVRRRMHRELSEAG